MARKKKKEQCPYCGKMFVYLSRHKCKVKARLEAEVDQKSDAERRKERNEARKKTLARKLRKHEKEVLEIIKEKKEIEFRELQKKVGITYEELDDILEVLRLRDTIKVKRDLMQGSWTKLIRWNKKLGDEVELEEVKVNRKKKDFVWNLFRRTPCFICPFTEKCNDTNQDIFNPKHCPFLTRWIKVSMKGEKEFNINFEEIKARLDQES
ncbi:MAG: hypothetical protein ACOC44_10875 [Promethearchaeia archaeon]